MEASAAPPRPPMKAAPPPPPGKGKGKGAPRPAPPPPGAARPAGPGQAVARRPSGPPRLRPLFWTTVAQAGSDSVWGELGEPAPFDVQQLERRFALAEPRAVAVAAAAAAGRSVSQEPRKRIRVLDDKTSQLLAIAFNKLPPPEQLVVAVDADEGFPEGVSDEGLLALHAAASEQREVVEQLRQLGIGEAELAQLDMPERYLWLIGAAPARVAKLAGAALLLGPARELAELKQGLDKVMACCREFRRSRLLRKCISTSLALGNCLNDGTARGGACAVALPDSLLKLDELRGVIDPTAAAGDARALSLLDFMAQALVDEGGAGELRDLRSETERLQGMARAAKAVSLEEAEGTCKSVCQRASEAMAGFEGVSPGSSGALALRVRRAAEDVGAATAVVEEAKAELAAAQRWSSSKGTPKGEDWFGAWGLFFEQLSGALGRARPRAEGRCQPRPLGAGLAGFRTPSPGVAAEGERASSAAVRGRSPAVSVAPPAPPPPAQPVAAAPPATGALGGRAPPAPPVAVAQRSPATVPAAAPMRSVLRDANGGQRTGSAGLAAKDAARVQAAGGAAAPPRPPPSGFITPGISGVSQPRRWDVVLDDDVRMEDLVKMRAQMAAPTGSARQFDCKENAAP